MREAAKSTIYFPDQALAAKVAKFVGEQASEYKPSKAYDLATHFLDEIVWRNLFLKTLPRRIIDEDVVIQLSCSGKTVGELAAQFSAGLVLDAGSSITCASGSG